MSGYGDPFYSEALFEWLCNFSTEKYPNMTNIHMHTNAMLWNERNWEKIKPANLLLNQLKYQLMLLILKRIIKLEKEVSGIYF